MKRILLENANNMRDLGGYAISLTTSTNYNQYIRSDIVESISKEEIAYLKKIGIETIIDLRKIEEITRKPNALKPYFNYYNINLLGDKAPQNEKDVATGYIDIISNKETMHEVFKTIAQTKGGVIFNCNAGKDRTGVIAMLLLLLAGVNETDIISDYMVSYNNIKDYVRNIHLNNPDLPSFLGTSTLEMMEETLKLFHLKFGNIESYFSYISINKSELEKIKNKLIKTNNI